MPTIFSSNNLDYIEKMNIISSDYVVTTVPAVVGGTTLINLSLGSNFYVTLGGDTTLAFTNPIVGMPFTARIYLLHDISGLILVSWPAAVRWPNGTTPTLTPTASMLDGFELTTMNNGTTWYGRTLGLNWTTI